MDSPRNGYLWLEFTFSPGIIGTPHDKSIVCPLSSHFKLYCPLYTVFLQGPHHSLHPSPPSSLCSIQGLTEGPGSPRGPVALVLRVTWQHVSPRGKYHVSGERCYEGPQGSLSSPLPGGTQWLQQPDSIKTSCLCNVLCVQFMTWLLPTFATCRTWTESVCGPSLTYWHCW